MSLEKFLTSLQGEQERAAGVAATVEAAAGYKPDEVAQYNRIAKITQLDPLAMADDPVLRAEGEKRAKLSAIDFDALINTHPHTANALSDLPTASVIHDDVQGTQRLEGAFGAYTKASAALVSAAPATLGGTLGSIRAANEVFLRPYTRAGAKAIGVSDPGKVVSDWLGRLQTSMTQATEALTPRASGDIEAGVYSGIRSFGQQVGAIGGALATGGVAGLVPRTMAFMTVPLFGEEFAKAEEKGEAAISAAGYATTQTGIELLTELGPTGTLLKSAKVGAPFFKGILKNAPEFLVKEVLGEQAAAHLQGLNEWSKLNPEKPFEDYLAERPSAAVQTLVATLVAGGGVIATSKALQRLTGEDDKARAAETMHSELSALSQAAGGAKLRERDPERMQEFMQAMAEDAGLTEVHVDARTLRDALLQTPVEVQQQFAASLPEVAARMEEAAATDSTIAIPVAEYTTRVSGTELDAVLLPNLKADPEGLTYSQTQEYYADQAESMQQAAADLEAEQAQNDEYQADVQNVRQQVLDQLTTAGRYRPEVNEKLADLRKAWYVTRAADLGMKPSELYAQFPSLAVGPEQVEPGALEQVAPEQARALRTPVELPSDETFTQAVDNTKGAELTPEGLLINLVRFQKQEQEGAKSVRTGVFYLPASSANVGYYRAAKGTNGGAYGGDNRFTGETLLRKPLFVKGATGGKAPEQAYLQLLGRPAFEDLARHVSNSVGFNKTPHLKEQMVEDFLARYAPEEEGNARQIIRVSQEGNRLRYALQELAVAHAVRQAGYDSVVGWSRSKAGPVISEVFDVREQTYPARGIPSLVHESFKQTSSAYGYRARDAARKATPDDLSPVNVKNLLRKTDWAILTAENPAAQPLSEEENAARMVDLKADLDAQGLQYTEVKGKYGGNEENSIAIFGITREQASELGQKYGQESVLTRDGLVYPDGTVNPARKVTSFEEVPGDFYTRVPSTGAAFSVDIDFDQRPPLTVERIGEVEVDGSHFSREQRTVLSGRMYGTGLRGGEARRLGEPGVDSRIKNRIYFYVDEGKGVFPEAGVGNARHDVTITNLYDGAKNPLRLPAGDMNTFEAAVLDAGFDGYYIKEAFTRQGAAVMLGDATKAVQVDLPEEGKLFQAEGAPKGFFNPNTFTTGLLKDADLSTYLHETGHFFLEAEAALAADPNAPQKVKDDFAKALNWMGVADVQSWQAMTLEQKRPYHEKYARGFEAYLMEGKAPSAELKSIFQTFASWLKHLYQSLRNLNVELSDEVRGVFDRMLASEAAIIEQEQIRRYEALLTGGATDEEAASYIRLGEQATQDAIEALQRRSIKDMKWVSGARSRALKAAQREAASKRKAIREEVTAEVMAERVNRVRTFLRKGEMTDETTGDLIKIEKGFRLDNAALAEMFPETMLARPDLTALRGMTRADGLHPNVVASMFDYQSGEALVYDLLDSENAGEKIKGITDQHMLERHGDLYDDRAIAAAADAAVHNEARAKFMATGLKMSMKSALPVSQIKRAAKEAAQAAIAAKQVGKIKPAQYTAAETKANKAAIKAAAKDPQEAQRAQRSALLNNQLAREAMNAQEEVRKGITKLNSLQRAGAQGAMRGDYLDQLNALLARYDLRTSAQALPPERKALREWLADKGDEISAVAPDVPEWVLDEANRRSYKELTMEEFRGLLDAVKGLELLARREEHQYQAIRDMKFGEERRAVLDRIKEFHPEAFDLNGEPEGLSPKFVKSLGDKATDAGNKFLGEFLNAENIINLLEDGQFGVVNESLFGRLSKAADWKASRLEAIHKKLNPLLQQYSYAERRAFGTRDITTGSVRGEAMTRENVLVVALLHGSTEGRERLANYGWSEEYQQKLIDLLDERDVKLANGIWELFDEDLWPELEALNKRTRGKAPPKVAATPHQAKGGALRGGYFRLKYDTHLDARAQHYDEMEGIKALAGGTLGQSARTAQGTSTERKQGVTMRPRLDLGVFAETISETVHDLAYREAALDTMRLLNDKGMRNTIITVAGEPAYLALLRRVREVAAPPRNPSGFIEHTLALARKNTIVTLMSGISTALLNVTGFFPAASRVNTGRLVKEIGLFFSPKMAEKYEQAITMSEYMRNRSQSFERELQDEIKKITVDKSYVPLPDTGTFLVFMTTVDKGVSVPVWHAAFRDGLEKFDNDQQRAVDYADHIVRQTQGTGRAVDMAAIMSGHGGYGQLKKTFTMFYSYFNSQLGLLVRSGSVNKHLAKRNPTLAAARFTKDMLLIWAIPAMLTLLAKEAATGDEEDEEKRMSKAIWAMASYGLGMIPLLRDVAPLYAGLMDKNIPQYGFKLSPAQFFFEAPAKSVASVGDILAGEGDDKDMRNIIMGGSVAIGLPGKLIADTTLGTKAVIEGEAGPQAILFGPPKK